MGINEDDLQVDIYRSEVPNAYRRLKCRVRLTYLPTGHVFECSRYNSPEKNKAECMKRLRQFLSDEGLL